MLISLTLHWLEASLGKPFLNTPTSVVVPPTSITMALGIPERKAAPLMLLVGPEEKVRTGYLVASSALQTVYISTNYQMIKEKFF